MTGCGSSYWQTGDIRNTPLLQDHQGFVSPVAIAEGHVDPGLACTATNKSVRKLTPTESSDKDGQAYDDDDVVIGTLPTVVVM